jgi:hypothetical protein
VIEQTDNETTKRFARYVPTRVPGKHPVWVAYALVALVGIAVIVNVVWFTKAHPDQTDGVFQAILLLVGSTILFNHSYRLERLEKRRQAGASAVGALTRLVDDAKSAARLAGHDEAHAQAIAQEILLTAVKSTGAWKATHD